MTQDILRDMLTTSSLFASLDPGEKERLAKTIHLVTLHENEILFNEGDKGQHFYIVVDGTVEIVKKLNTPDEFIVAVRDMGEIVGEMSLLNSGVRTASVRAAEKTRLFKLSHREFSILIEKQPDVVFEIVRVLSNRLNQAHELTIYELRTANDQLRQANAELSEAQTQIIEKEKLERELQVAYEIQMSILPSEFPELEGFDLGAQLVPARTVGGDLFDFIPLNDHQVGVVIGDVSDKGVPAAIFMAQARALLHAEASRAVSPSPHEVLERVNQLLLKMNAKELFVTVIYGVLDNRTGEFFYSRAGHDLPLLLLPNGEVEIPPKGRGQLLGILPEIFLTEQVIQLEPGMTLLLYTDGGTDVRSPEGVTFGFENLVETFRDCHGLDAQDTCNHILKMLNRYRQQTAQYDDVTLVAIHAQG